MEQTVLIILEKLANIYKDRFYAVGLTGMLFEIDPMTFKMEDLKMNEINKLSNCSQDQHESQIDELCAYLLESCGRLYLVSTSTKTYLPDENSEWGKPLHEIKVYDFSCLCSGNCKRYVWDHVTEFSL